MLGRFFTKEDIVFHLTKQKSQTIKVSLSLQVPPKSNPDTLFERNMQKIHRKMAMIFSEL